MKTTKILAFMAIAAFILTACSKKSYLSEDLRLRDLYGNVESITMNYWTDYFDENGTIVTPNIQIERDSKNRIIRYAFNNGNNDGDKYLIEKFEYDGKGNVTKYEKELYEGGISGKCFYDKDGHLEKMYAEGYAEGDNYVMEKTFTILETDEHGNWTKRNVHTMFEYAGEVEESDDVETREITYRGECQSYTKETNKPSEETLSKKSPNSNFMEGLEGIDDGESQFYSDQYVMIYLSNHKFVSGDNYITFGYDGMYFNGVCQTGAIEVLSFNATQAKCMADSPYNGRYIFIVDCEDGSLRLHTGDTFYTDNY